MNADKSTRRDTGASKAKRRGRPFNTSTPLGQVMLAKGLTVRKVEHGTDISHRRLSDYLAGRKEFVPDHLVALSQFLEVPARVLRGVAPVSEMERGLPSDPMPSGNEFLAAIRQGKLRMADRSKDGQSIRSPEG